MAMIIFNVPKGGANNMDKSEKQYKELQNHQIEMTPKTWERLQANGVTEETELVLDFMYYSPNKDDAQSLKDFLRDYETTIEKKENGDLWIIKGKTSPTKVSLDILLQWVDYMVAAGWDHDCYFDGWGAEVP